MASFRKKSEFIHWGRKIFEKILVFFGVLPELLTTKLYKVQFYLNGILFSLGAIFALVLKVSFSDLVFGWSTSLQISSKQVYQFFQLISAPWSWFWKGASPSFELVDQSHFFRVNSKFYLDQIINLQSLTLLSTWWKFFLACFLFYSIFPRFFLLLWNSKREKRKKTSNQITAQEPIQVASLFELNREENIFYHSLLSMLMSKEIELDKDLGRRSSKIDWLKKWKDSVFYNLSQEEIEPKELLKIIETEIEKKSLKFKILLCEASCFSPYFSFDSQKPEVDHYQRQIVIDTLDKFLSLNDSKPGLVYKFYEQLEKNIKLYQKQGNFKKWLGFAMFSLGVVALTGGLGAGAVLAVGKALGLAGLAAKTTAVALLGGGMFLVGSDSQSKGKMIFGCGGILAEPHSKLSQEFYKEYLASGDLILRDLIKLKTYIDFSFFDIDFFERNKKDIFKKLDFLQVQCQEEKIKNSNELEEIIIEMKYLCQNPTS
ncbi:MAG: DUF2868 domain-containing protein [Halobacteriovoraceae bacterium]|nr:DUF2868 domain-containing protein [Halobacteriovoraceae bacterium]